MPPCAESEGRLVGRAQDGDPAELLGLRHPGSSSLVFGMSLVVADSARCARLLLGPLVAPAACRHVPQPVALPSTLVVAWAHMMLSIDVVLAGCGRAREPGAVPAAAGAGLCVQAQRPGVRLACSSHGWLVSGTRMACALMLASCGYVIASRASLPPASDRPAGWFADLRCLVRCAGACAQPVGGAAGAPRARHVSDCRGVRALRTLRPGVSIAVHSKNSCARMLFAALRASSPMWLVCSCVAAAWLVQCWALLRGSLSPRGDVLH